jgi:F-type H+-transporting ATPase subunit b
MNMKNITSVLTGLILCFTASSVSATIQQSSLIDYKSFAVAELDMSSATHSRTQSQFSDVNTMIEPSAGDVKSHGQTMNNLHTATINTIEPASGDVHAVAHGETTTADHHDDHGAGSAGLPQFNPKWFPSQIFWLAISFIIMYVFFAKSALPNVAASLDTRETRIRTDIETAEKINDKAEAVKGEYEQLLQSAKDKSSQIIADTQVELKEKADEAVSAFRSNQDVVVADLEKTIDKAKNKALADMHSVAADAARQAAAKIIDVDADLSKVKSVVEKLDKAA